MNVNYSIKAKLDWILEEIRKIKCYIVNTQDLEINQNNIDVVKYINNYPSFEQSILTIELNNLPQYTISQIESLWFVVYVWDSELSIDFQSQKPNLIATNLYKVINTGKGTYGVGGIQLTQDNLLFISSTVVNLEDIENNPLTQIYTIEDLTGLTVSEYINQLNPAFLFQDVNIAPRLIKVIEPGNEADYLFLPPGGLYGQGQLQTTIGDFQLLNQNQSGGVSSNTPQDLPEDFQIYCTYNKSVNNSNSMLYRTDTDRGFDIMPYVVGQKVFTTNWVGRINNTLVVMGKINSDTGNLFILSLRDCKIINNVLFPQDFSFKFLPQVYRNGSNIPFVLHSAVIHRGYCYFATRTQGNNTAIPTQLFKINPYDLDDVTIKELDIAGPYNGSTGVMQAYKNNIYFMVSTTIGAGNRFIKIDENLENPEILFTVGDIDSTKRVPRDSVFLIYNDEVYIPYVNNLAGNPANDQIGMFVYDLFKRTLNREAVHVIDSGSPTKPSPHWISEFGGKIIFHTANNISSNKHLISINATTLALEGNGKINLPDGGITNNNSITRSGYIYLNSEYSLNNGYLYKVKYNDIPATIDFSQADSPIGFYSLGSLERDVNEETVISKTSQLFNDAEFITLSDIPEVDQDNIPIAYVFRLDEIGAVDFNDDIPTLLAAHIASLNITVTEKQNVTFEVNDAEPEYNFDMTSTNWYGVADTNETLRQWIMNQTSGMSEIVVTDLTNIGGRVRCNISHPTGVYLKFRNFVSITKINRCNMPNLMLLDVRNNLLNTQSYIDSLDWGETAPNGTASLLFATNPNSPIGTALGNLLTSKGYNVQY